jgi:tetratricopeptide (TPR) repeat protein
MLHNAEAVRLPGTRVLENVQDTLTAASALREQWTPALAVESLASSDTEIVKLAIGHLALHGAMRHSRAVAVLLHHDDPLVVKLAEDALWRVWMRAGTERGNLQLRSAVEKIGRGDFGAALGQLAALLESEPAFAEAHHQRGIIYSLLEKFDEAESELVQALDLNPLHFEAKAGLGHIAANRGDAEQTLRHYHDALRIHPRYSEIRSAVGELEGLLQGRSTTH